MADNLNQPDELEADRQAPTWIKAALEVFLEREQFAAMAKASEGSEEFLQQCKEAALTARKLAALSNTVMDIGFMPLSFSKYLKKVEELAGVAAEPVIRYFGILNPEVLDDQSVTGFGRLWSALGIPLREALANLRISLLHPENALWKGIRLRGAGSSGALEFSEREIGHLQARASASQLLEQHRLELMLLHAYENAKKG